jgi:hypothetical protein
MSVGKKTKKRRSGVSVNEVKNEKKGIFATGINISPTRTRRTVYGKRVFREKAKAARDIVKRVRRDRRMASISDIRNISKDEY